MTKAIIGVPDLIIEIVSPSNSSYNYITKLNVYSDFRVREYWIVDPMKCTILQYTLQKDGFVAPIISTFKDSVKVEIFDDLKIDFSKIEQD